LKKFKVVMSEDWSLFL